jgi:hypothetical protein
MRWMMPAEGHVVPMCIGMLWGGRPYSVPRIHMNFFRSLLGPFGSHDEIFTAKLINNTTGGWKGNRVLGLPGQGRAGQGS